MRAAWDQFWFAPADARVIALLRIGWGLLGLWQYATIWAQLDPLLTDTGTYPLDARDRDTTSLGRYSVHSWFAVRDLAEVQDLHALILGTFALCVVGLGSRIVVPLSWLGAISIVNRNGAMTDGSDAVMRVFGFYLMFMDTGAAWSLDARWRRARREEVSGWALRMFQVNVCLLYLTTGLSKLSTTGWQEGWALFHAFQSSLYWRVDMDPWVAMGAFQDFAWWGNWFTLAFEIGFPVVLWDRARGWVLAAGVALHVSVFATMNLGAFSEAILWTYLAFLAPRRP